MWNADEAILQLSPELIRKLLAGAHALQYPHKRIANAKAHGAPELEDVRNRAEDLLRVLDLHGNILMPHVSVLVCPLQDAHVLRVKRCF